MFYAVVYDSWASLSILEPEGKKITDVLGYDDAERDEYCWGDGEDEHDAIQTALYNYLDPNDDWMPPCQLPVLVLETDKKDVVKRMDVRVIPIRVRHEVTIEWGEETDGGSVTFGW